MSQKKRKKRNYVDNKRLYEELSVYYYAYKEAKEKGSERPRLPDYVARCAILIAENLATKRNFAQYSYREDFVQDAIENIVKYIHYFNPEKSTYAFSYMTKMATNAFIRRILEEEKKQYEMLAYSQNFLINDQLNPSQVVGATKELYDNLQEFMQEYEEREERRALKKKQRRRKNKVKLEVNHLEFAL